jgi:type IV pilus assembly protein PilN
MPRINLLPWREEQRRERKLHFLVALGAATVAAMVFAFAAYLMMDSMVSAQQRRNDQLRTEIKLLDKQIEEINTLESQKQKFIARMEIIEKLQRSRPEIVHLFDEIVRTLPEGTYLTGIKQADHKLTFEGVAQSSTRVSSFMRNIDSSEWLKNPELEVVESKKGDKGSDASGSRFVLFAEQVSRVGGDEEAPVRGAGARRVARRGGTP